MRVGWKTQGVAMLSIAIAALLLAGCGSSGTEASTSLSKAEYIKKANQICDKGLTEKDEAVKAGLEAIPRNEFPNLSQQRLKELSERVFPPYRRMTEDLAALTPPPKDDAAIENIVAEFEAAMKNVEANPLLLAHGSPFYKAGKAAKAYGLEHCTF